MPTIHLIIKGKVQGVFYRVSAKDVAEKLGISGWIKNTEDGNVEAMISGSSIQTEEFIRWCHSGPKKAQVKEVSCSVKEEKVFEKFLVIH